MTFTLVARCQQTGHLGVATASASLAVGARCPYVRAGIAAVTTQNRTDPTLGPRLLDALATNTDPDAALASLMANAAFPEWRQVAVVDKHGRVAAFHGERCSGTHSEARGDGAISLGNLLASPEVPAAMMAAFVATGGSLGTRLLAALDGGLAAGGEIKPMRSAALKIATSDPFPYTDLRVDGAENPLALLRGLWHDWEPEAEKCRAWAIDPYGV